MSKDKESLHVKSVTVRFAGDSGDGMQLTGDRFTDTSAVMGNDISTFPDFPAEIRAPSGTLPGVSSFQVQFSESIIFTAGDKADVLIAMNPAALKVNIPNLKKKGLIILNENVFDALNLKKAAWKEDPLTSDALNDYQVIKVPLTDVTKKALKDQGLLAKEVERCKNFFALGIMFWVYDRDKRPTIEWIKQKFDKRPEIVKANITALEAGYTYADITEIFTTQYHVAKAPIEKGTYRKVSGNEALAIGCVAAAELADRTLIYGSYPITPASSILHELAKFKNYNVKTIQAEDEIAACGIALGAAYGGKLGLTGTSGPGLCLKSEMIGLAIMAELPLVVINVQRGGPSTGMPTKTEQSDLLQSMYGRNGESPVAILAPKTPADCFDTALEAIEYAVTYMTPVIILSDGYIANGSQPWLLPDIDKLKKIKIKPPYKDGDIFYPYARDPETLARPWAYPGLEGFEHRIGGLSKADLTGNVSYDPLNNQKMFNYRMEKIMRIQNVIPDAVCNGAQSGKVLVLSWGGTYGSVHQAVEELKGEGIGHVHIRHLNPFPKNLDNIFSKFDKVIIPELNSGHLLTLMRTRYPEVIFDGVNKVQGQPFSVDEVAESIKKELKETVNES